MKRFLFVITSLLVLFVATAFISIDQHRSADSDPVVFKLMEVTYLYDLLFQNHEPSREEDATWLDVGFRAKYGMAKKYASIEILERTFGVPVFLRGPHDETMNFNSTTSFGYYNPEFIDVLRTTIEATLDNPKYKEVAEMVYHRYLESMARTYHSAYIFLGKDKEKLEKLKTKYLMQMAKPGGTSGGSFQEYFRSFADELSTSQRADWYEAVTAPAFWVRRSIDGTDQKLFAMLDLVMTKMKED